MSNLQTVIGRGTLASRPAVTAVPIGSLYYVTDTSTMCRNNGTTWESVEGPGAALTVDEVDGSPSVANVTRLTVSNGTLTDNGGGHVTVTTGGGSGGGYTQGARVYNSAAISAANGSLVTLTFDSERYDTDTIHDTTTNTSRLTCKTAGIYVIAAALSFAANATGARQAIIRVNGTTSIASDTRNAVSGSTTVDVAISAIWQLAVNDYVELAVIQTSGGALNVAASGDYSPEFMMQRIG